MTTVLNLGTLNDRQLVELHLTGNRDAFRQIVERYQAMVCALGVSACGDVGRSEDLAQEVFVAAWKKLPELREPDKLRAWLTGIARNLIVSSFREQKCTPTAAAEVLCPEAITDQERSPRDHAVNADEFALMWKALGGIPANYREPMVLFYREQRSISAVAEVLEISEDTVRQRLTRGRALLTVRMAKRVEETLERSGPSPAFTGVVLMALPVAVATLMSDTAYAATTATAAGAGGGAIPAGAGVNGASAAGGFVATAVKGGGLAVFSAIPALFLGVWHYLLFRNQLEGAVSATHRRKIAAKHLVWPLIGTATFLGLGAVFLANSHPEVVVTWWGQTTLVLADLLFAGLLVGASMCSHAGVAKDPVPAGVSPAPRIIEYRSRARFLGLPLIHVCFQMDGKAYRMRGAARGWIAFSTQYACGGLFACGAVATAPLSIGLVSVGLVSLGLISLGVVAVGGFAFGVFSSGVLSFGWIAARAKTYAVAGEFAEGHYAIASHANDLAATTFFRDHLFFSLTPSIEQLNWVWMGFIWIVPLVLIGSRLWRMRPTR